MDYFTFLCFFNYDNYFLSLGVILDLHAILFWPKFYHNLLLNFFVIIMFCFCSACFSYFCLCKLSCLLHNPFVSFTFIYQIRNNHFLIDFNMMCYDHNSFNSSFGFSMLRINYAGSVSQSYVLCFMLVLGSIICFPFLNVF